MSQTFNNWLIDCGDVGSFEVNEQQMNAILLADQNKVRFVNVGKAVINIAFIRAMVRQRSNNIQLTAPVIQEEIKELTDEEREQARKRLAQIKDNIKRIGRE